MATLWKIETIKSWGAADPTKSWSNTYELVTTADVGPATLQPVADTIIAAERTIHFNAVNFIRYVISPWHMTPTGYDPINELSVAQALLGSRAGGTNQAYDLNIAYMLRFNPVSGRTGRRFYRGCIHEGDVDAGATGAAAIVSGSTLAVGGTDLVAFQNAIAPLMPAGSGAAKLHMLAVLKSGAFFDRPIASVGGPSIVPNRRNHKWFNRTKKLAV